MLRGVSGDRPWNRPRRVRSGMVIILVAIACPLLLARGGVPGRDTAEAAIAVEILTDPPQERILSDKAPALLTFKASMDGKPLDAGHLQVGVNAPSGAGGLFAPFRAVAGTTMLQLASDLVDGKFAVEYLFPIDGVYSFDFAITPVAGGPAIQPASIHQSLHVPADLVTVRRGWLFSAALFCLGGIIGVWHARRGLARHRLPSGAAIVSGGLIVGGLVAMTSSWTFADHGPREVVFQKGPQVIQGADGWALEVRPAPEQAVVGDLLDLTVTLMREGKVFPGAVEVALHVYNLKDDRTVLRTNIVAPQGSTSQRFQLVESVPHSCTVTARPVSGDAAMPVMLTGLIGIDVADAPLKIGARLRALGLALGLVGAGLAGGFLLASGVQKLPGRVER
jgi:hypothetical protein